MAYQVCISKTAPCCVIPWTVGYTLTTSPCLRSIDVYGCSYDPIAGEKSYDCCQGTTTPVGSCCAFTVPTGTTQVIVELWGAGGGGGAAAANECCGMNVGAGAGTYARKTIAVVGGDVLTLCAGAGGCKGGGQEGINGATSWCCCGQRGACSFVSRNGTICADAQGGKYGPSTCGGHCCNGCGTCGIQPGAATGDCGLNVGCTGYVTGISENASGSPGMSQSCSGYCTNQLTWAGGTAFGADENFWTYMCNCWSYWRWNTACANSGGISGPGGDAASGSTAYNTPGSANYACATTNNNNCIRSLAPPSGNFPGGGGASGVKTGCCNANTTGGNGGSGYVRVWY